MPQSCNYSGAVNVSHPIIDNREKPLLIEMIEGFG